MIVLLVPPRSSVLPVLRATFAEDRLKACPTLATDRSCCRLRRQAESLSYPSPLRPLPPIARADCTEDRLKACPTQMLNHGVTHTYLMRKRWRSRILMGRLAISTSRPWRIRVCMSDMRA